MRALFGLDGAAAALLLALLPLLESATLIGFFIPGEAALILGGVLARTGYVPLELLLPLGAAGAIIGDSIGYWVGKRYGRRMLGTRLGRWIGARRWAAAEEHLRRRGFAAIAIGRFGPFVRSMVPGAAGVAGMPYGRFLVANVIGGGLWAVASVMVGYLAAA